MNTNDISDVEAGPSLRSLSKFRREASISTTTAWRWENQGWLETVNIAGRKYVTDEAIKRFKKRAAAGEFSREHHFSKKHVATSRG